MATGTAKWFNSEEGFGFIYSATASSAYRSLEENQGPFDITAGPKGPEVENIHPRWGLPGTAGRCRLDHGGGDQTRERQVGLKPRAKLEAGRAPA